eukprot:EG_transcript_7864
MLALAALAALWTAAHAAPGLPATPPFRPLPVRGRFYMYEEEELNQTYLIGRTGWPNLPSPWNWRFTLDHMPEPFIHAQLRAHPLRTLDPQRATVFFVPLLVSMSHLEGKCRFNDYRADHSTPSCNRHYRRMEHAVEALQTSPFWRASEGRDHVVICHHWRCLWDASYTEPIHEIFRHATVYYFEGSQTKTVQSPWCQQTHCAPLGQVHRILPYVDSRERWNFRPPPIENRTHAVFFAGHFGRTHGGYHVREHIAKVRDALTNRSDLRDWVVHDTGLHPCRAWSADLMLHSRYCLAPAGDSSTSARIYYAIAAGCVPVFITHPDIWHSLPFPRLLDWRAFALFIDAADFRARPLESIKEAIDRAPYAQLRENLERVVPYLSTLHPASKVGDAMVAEFLAGGEAGEEA